MPGSDYLTKSRYAAGLQCLPRLWLDVHEPTDWREPELGSLEDTGSEIGRMAYCLFPGGILVKEAPWEHAQAVARTIALMADISVPAIFFRFGGGKPQQRINAVPKRCHGRKD